MREELRVRKPNLANAQEAGTARIYTDFLYFTEDPKLAEDGSDLFNYLTGYSEQEKYKELLVAPLGLRECIVCLIEDRLRRCKRVSRPGSRAR